MHNNDHIPVHHVRGSNPKPMKLNRHHSVRYYVHRVHESLTTRVSKMICATFLGLLFIVGLITFILWLSLRPHRPRFHIHQFNMPGLTQNYGFENAVITFNVTARNANQNIGVNYESMDAAVFYRDQKIGYTPLLFPFYQEPKNTTEVDGELSGASLTVSSERWSEFQSDRADGSVVFRLELTSVIRFKISSWESKRHTMHANCDVGVGSDGSLLTNFKDKRCPVYFS
ncbi:NDR1/HIN1-like protein 26 [Vigna unguiculata]|uniref:Late embryogenesis abundant protein n=1 Tax=Vigna unguiculata TaxID=3917 RepID=A0A4D6N691_VIGUN|nr:NDR1/HIN1-like protein 26 [Vigna unguiculata]QCE08391.1 Late embryogenesis abundant protein [Vigna unguiculata]